MTSYYEKDGITIYNGDCLEELKNIPDGSVDLTVTSPPYDNLRTYNGNNDLWNEQVWKDCIEGLYRVTKECGVVVWIVGDATVNGSETGTSFKQALWARELYTYLPLFLYWCNKKTPTKLCTALDKVEIYQLIPVGNRDLMKNHLVPVPCETFLVFFRTVTDNGCALLFYALRAWAPPRAEKK